MIGLEHLNIERTQNVYLKFIILRLFILERSKVHMVLSRHKASVLIIKPPKNSLVL